MLPGDDNLYVWQCHEVHGTGTTLRDARTGRILRQITYEGDCGRCMAADIDPTHPGYEMWSLCTNGILDAQGEVIANPRGLSFNFGIWWDGDLNRELLDRTTVSKYNWTDKTIETVIKFPGVHSNNGTKANPSLMADILGDWREEVLFPTFDNQHLRLYLTALPTDYRIPSLLQNVPYRMSVTLQNTAYNQPTQLDKRLSDLVRKE
jgi:rhamnogalacturonan endolyase